MIGSAELLREQVAWACRILAEEGYEDLTLGHLSARVPGEEAILIKRKGVVRVICTNTRHKQRQG